MVATLTLLGTACGASREDPMVATDESALGSCPWKRTYVGEGAHAIGPLALRATAGGDLVAAYRATWFLRAPEMRTAKLTGAAWSESSLSNLHGAAGNSLGFSTHPDGRSLIAFAGLVGMLPKDAPVRLWSNVGTAAMTTSTLTTTDDTEPHVATAVTADGVEHVLVADSGRVRHFTRASNATAFVRKRSLVTGLVYAFDARAHGDDLHIAYSTSVAIRHAMLHRGVWSQEPVATGLSKSLALAVDESGRPRVAYQELTSDALGVILAAKDTNGWSTTSLAQELSGLGTRPLALALAPSGDAVVAFEAPSAFPSSSRTQGLVVATVRAGSVAREIVSRDQEDGAKAVALAVDPLGRTHVLYQAESGNDLQHLVRAPSANGVCP